LEVKDMARLTREGVAYKINGLSAELAQLQDYNNQLYAQIMRNQDLYMENHIDSLKCNKSLERERTKTLKRISKVQSEIGTLQQRLQMM
jgi:hypothetical protein